MSKTIGTASGPRKRTTLYNIETGMEGGRTFERVYWNCENCHQRVSGPEVIRLPADRLEQWLELEARAGFDVLSTAVPYAIAIVAISALIYSASSYSGFVSKEEAEIIFAFCALAFLAIGMPVFIIPTLERKRAKRHVQFAALLPADRRDINWRKATVHRTLVREYDYLILPPDVMAF